MHSTPLSWTQDNTTQQAVWLTDMPVRPPAHVTPVDDNTRADQAYRWACEGHALLWQGDFHNARQLLSALARRCEPPAAKRASTKRGSTPESAEPSALSAEVFHRHRQQQSRRARILSMLLVPFEAGYHIPLRRAPDVSAACTAAWGTAEQSGWLSLNALQGATGAYEWQKRGVAIEGLEVPIHACYGVFSPVRGEYLQLVQNAPLPAQGVKTAFDIGTGTGVLAIVLAQRGVERIIATDISERALNCARDNIQRHQLTQHIELQALDTFPAGLADLIVCNPPWLPARPTSVLEQAVYDPEHAMLKGVLGGAAAHLHDHGELWLILSDLAEHLGLRRREELLDFIHAGGLEVIDTLHTRPQHGKSQAANDLLAAARQRETTTLWRLRKPKT